MNLDFLKDMASKLPESVTSQVAETAKGFVSDNVGSALQKLGITDSSTTESESTEIVENASEAEIEEKGGKMLQVMDWAFDKANGNIPGLGTTAEMAENYFEKYGNVTNAIDKLVAWQVAAAASSGFVTSLGGLATMPLTLPANIASTMAIQMRLIGCIAELAGYHENTEERRTAMYLCLLGGEAANTLSSVGTQFAVKFATAQLKRLPGTVLTKINQRVGFRLVTKFGEKGVVNIAKAIPILGGVVGGSIDAFSTYSIAQAAKGIFLNEIMENEKMEMLEREKIRLLINLARIDNNYGEDEKAIIRMIANGLSVSPNIQKSIMEDIDHPKNFEVDFSQFKDNLMLSTSTYMGLYQVAAVGGISPVEKVYLKKIANELGLTDFDVSTLEASAAVDYTVMEASAQNVSEALPEAKSVTVIGANGKECVISTSGDGRLCNAQGVIIDKNNTSAATLEKIINSFKAEYKAVYEVASDGVLRYTGICQ